MTLDDLSPEQLRAIAAAAIEAERTFGDGDVNYDGYQYARDRMFECVRLIKEAHDGKKN